MNILQRKRKEEQELMTRPIESSFSDFEVDAAAMAQKSITLNSDVTDDSDEQQIMAVQQDGSSWRIGSNKTLKESSQTDDEYMNNTRW